jgi:hypothetical protein
MSFSWNRPAFPPLLNHLAARGGGTVCHKECANMESNYGPTNLIYGHCKRPGDDIEYAYDAIWRNGVDGLIWNASIRVERGQALPMHPSGIIRGADSSDGEVLVRAAVTRAIERRADAG